MSETPIVLAYPAPDAQVGARTTRVTLFAVAVDGVPAIHVDESLWTCLELLLH